MKPRCLVCAILLATWGCSSEDEPGAQMPTGKQPSFKELIFKASDGHLVFADFFPSKKPNTKAVILMFHQAGSNASEYETIAPKIAALGFDCIAIDQRAGGDMWGRVNRTVNKSGAGDYMEAYKDLLGTLKYAENKKYEAIIAWGSSYSASLVLKLALENSTINGVLSFSPGEYMDDKTIVSTWASSVIVPTLFASTEDEWQDGRSQLFEKLHTKDKVSIALPGGVHGSSTLIEDKSNVARLYMEKVRAFLKQWEKS